MASVGSAVLGPRTSLSRLLDAPRFEVIPVGGIEERVSTLPEGSRVTVTASPAHGLERTVEVAERLAAAGHIVVPHLAARMVSGRDQLDGFVERLVAAGVEEVFVVGGDATPPAGELFDAGDLLEELASLGRPFARVGIGGYPEGHPLIADERLLEALRRKQPHADAIVTQLCFDAGALVAWIETIRAAGIDLPVTVGLPGVVERRRLAEISLKSGVGASLRYLRKHGRQIAALTRSRRYDPTPLATQIAAHIGDPGLGIAGAHLFTFNQIEATRDWVLRVA